MVPVVRITGRSGAGKTHVVASLVTELKRRGYRVATVKHSAHGFDVDTEGKDSWQHAKAGSDAVVISSPSRIALIRKADHDLSISELSRFIGLDFDIVIAEGFKGDKGPMIEVHRKEQGGELISSPEGLMAIVTDEQLDTSVPQFPPDDARGLADLIEEVFLSRAEQDIIALFVNGQQVPMNSFVRGVFSNVVLAMVSSLKRIPAVDSISLYVKRKTAR